jgi:hypothetical protein
MKKTLHILLLLFFVLLCKYSSAQQPVFTDSAIAAIAIQRGIQPVDIPGFIAHYRKINSSADQTTMRSPTVVVPQSTYNFGFENGDFSGWTGYIGDNDSISATIWSNVQNGIFSTTNNAALINCNVRHTIMDTAAIDNCGNFQILPPGLGSAVARLNNNCSNYMGAGLKKTWTVTTSSATLFISYALLLNDGGHSPNEAPYFKYSIKDSSNLNILLERTIFTFDTLYSFLVCPTDPFTSYQTWRTDTIDLSNYINQTVEISFEVAGCIFGGHFGYAYINVDLPNLSNIYTLPQNTFSLYPNPSTNIVTLQSPHSLSPDDSFVITDLSGRIINVPSERNANGWTISSAALSAGIYMISFYSSNGVSTNRFIVE